MATVPKIIIWHNNACSTSRKVLELLKELPVTVEIREYLKNPPDADEIRGVLKKMKAGPQNILRKKDKVFQELFADKVFNDDAWIEVMSEHPSIIERPILIMGREALLGRPADENLKHRLQQLL